MNLLILVWSYLKARLMNTVLNIVLLSLGISVICIIILVGYQLEGKIASNSKGIDLVVGAKGSPLQIILCSIFHVDFPTGNIKLMEAERLASNRLVKKAIPLALGDSYQNFRIVGTDTSFANLYHASLETGDWWQVDLEVVAGASVARQLQLKPGDTFNSAHGLTLDGDSHEEHPYKIVGIMKPSGTVVDNLLLTNVASIWEVHDLHSPAADSLGRRSPLVPAVLAGDSSLEITSMLIRYRNPLAAIQLPRLVNGMTSMQAASPAFETARLYSILGVGVDAMAALAIVLIVISALSIFIALHNSLRERRFDLAMMRAMGASRSRLFLAVVIEGSSLTFAGSLVGLLTAHFVVVLMSMFTPELAAAGIGGGKFYLEEVYLVGGSLVLGIFSSLVPAVEAYRTDIHQVLAGN